MHTSAFITGARYGWMLIPTRVIAWMLASSCTRLDVKDEVVIVDVVDEDAMFSNCVAEQQSLDSLERQRCSVNCRLKFHQTFFFRNFE